jgi:copper chaperone CopZ
MEIKLRIDGMTCGGCKSAVERVLAAQPGVTSVAVDLDGASAVVAAADGTLPQSLAAAVEDAGYDAHVEG